MIAPFTFEPTTEQGGHYINLLRECAGRFATSAAEYDRTGEFVHDHFAHLGSVGAGGAAVPVELGGMGVTSIHDLAVGNFELAQGCASTAIALWMHVTSVRGLIDIWATLRDSGHPVEEALADILRNAAQGREWIAATGTEAGTFAVLYPLATAVRTDEGWRINGRKIFSTLSPAATRFVAFVRIAGRPGEPDRFAFALVDRDAPGVTVVEDWDALGMRGSGSGTVVYENALAPAWAVAPRYPVGTDGGGEGTAGASSGGLTGVAVGIAQAARDCALQLATSRPKAPHGHTSAQRVSVQLFIGEMEVALASAKAMLREQLMTAERAAANGSSMTPEEQVAVRAALQTAGVAIQRACIKTVEHAMTVAGGASYMSRSPLSRHYRDVRALPFMYPQEPEALQYIGMAAAGLEPVLDL